MGMCSKAECHRKKQKLSVLNCQIKGLEELGISSLADLKGLNVADPEDKARLKYGT